MQGEKVALVTGSSSGIGCETAFLLSKSGFYTYVHRIVTSNIMEDMSR
jgi:NAD(P)-dependent dehydrogenase (short-subunit alcohol dehydrogenase family)